VGPKDVKLSVAFCGVCHSDLHTVKSEWGPANYPCVPGHEIVGTVTEVGAEVTKFKVGDKAGVGCMVGSCKTHKPAPACGQCKGGCEQSCSNGGSVFTYNAKLSDTVVTYGGYSSDIVCTEEFVLRMPENLPLDAAAPLLCAGITTYSPLVQHGLNAPGKKVGVVGLGGLGCMAVKIASAFGAEVTVISTSPNKEATARELGAKKFLLSTDAEAMKAAVGSLDGILDTVSATHDIDSLLGLIGVRGTLVLLGVPPNLAFSPFSLIFGEKKIAGSLIGGVQITQEMLDFCGKHNIVSEIEKIDIKYINDAYARLLKNDVRGRFVIDMATLSA